MPWGRRRWPLLVAAAVFLGGCGSDDAGEAMATTVGPTTTREPRGGIADIDFEALVGALDSSAVGDPDDERRPYDGALRLLDLDLLDLDGDGDDEAVVTVRTADYSTRPSSAFLVYRWSGGAAELITTGEWGRPDDHGIRSVDVNPSDDGPDSLVVQRFESTDEDCCAVAVEQRTWELDRDRLKVVGDPVRWLVIRRPAPTSPAGPARDPIGASFLPGSRRFAITGDVSDETGPVTLDALAEQTLTIRVDDAADGDPAVTVTVTAPDGTTIAEVASGTSTEPAIDLPASGTYTITVRATDPVGYVSPDDRAPFWVDAELGDG